MTAVNHFDLEPLLVSRLESIPDLKVLSVADADDKTITNSRVPTAVTAFQGDDVLESNDFAIRMRSAWSVSLFLRSAVKERKDAEGEMVAAIVSKLHGWGPGGGYDTLALQSVIPDSYDNGSLREYAMLFEVERTLHPGRNS